MKIDITCSKEEFSEIIKSCYKTQTYGDCSDCVLRPFCGEEDEIDRIANFTIKND